MLAGFPMLWIAGAGTIDRAGKLVLNLVAIGALFHLGRQLAALNRLIRRRAGRAAADFRRFAGESISSSLT